MLYSLSVQREENERNPGLLCYIEDFAILCHRRLCWNSATAMAQRQGVIRQQNSRCTHHHKQMQTGFALKQTSPYFWRRLLSQRAWQESFILLACPETLCSELQLSILASVFLSAVNILHLHCMQFIFLGSNGCSGSSQHLGIILLLHFPHFHWPCSAPLPKNEITRS